MDKVCTVVEFRQGAYDFQLNTLTKGKVNSYVLEVHDGILKWNMVIISPE